MSAAVEIFAPLKVNLFLEVLGRRPDGFHEIFTVMETVSIGDWVRVERSESLTVQADRADVPDGEKNLAARIVRAAERRLGTELPARITISKVAPPGSGLGGGSSDAVAALEGVLRVHDMTIDPAQLVEIAAAVGSDTAFFVRGGTAVCRGRGEIVGDRLDAGERHYVLLWGAPPCPTKEVYAALEQVDDPRDGARFVAALRDGAMAPFNRLEAAAFRFRPELRVLADEIERLVRRRPVLSGSGSAFYIMMGSATEAEALAGVVGPSSGLVARAARTYHGNDAP